MSEEGSQRICIQQDNGVSNKIMASHLPTTDVVEGASCRIVPAGDSWKGLYASEGCPLVEGTVSLPFVDDGDSGEKILQLFVVTL